jgi:ABC-2 type transport system permease protein
VSADAISGERERGTLEILLLAPVSRRSIVIGKLVGAQALWLATFAVSVPYVLVLGNGVRQVGPALLVGLLTGALLAFGLSSLGLLISALSRSNKISLSVSLFVLLALYTPTQLPALPQGWFGLLLGRLDPVAAGMRYIDVVLVTGHSPTAELGWLVTPAALALIAGAGLLGGAGRILRLSNQ